MASDRIVIRGAREHNLKNIDLEIPRDQLTVITGVSGSGKSSLAFDTIYAEGPRRYVESLSAYARQFLEPLDTPDVDQITGICPAIPIRQKNATRHPRSTVATQPAISGYVGQYSGCGLRGHARVGRSLVGQTRYQNAIGSLDRGLPSARSRPGDD